MAKKTRDATPAQQVCRHLSQLLANTYILYVKTQNFHWNVVDPRFYSLHLLLEKQYEELGEAIDEIAERIRMVQGRSPGSMRQFLELGTLHESSKELSGDDMLRELTADHEDIVKGFHHKIEVLTDLGDDGTADLFIQRLRAHEKAAWMLRSHL